MVKIIIGIIMVAGGLSGKLVLIGTQSGAALAVLGVAMIAWGVVRIVRQKQGGNQNKS